MKPKTQNNVYVWVQKKVGGYWRKYKGQELKLGRLFRYDWNTHGRYYVYDTIAKHNTL